MPNRVNVNINVNDLSRAGLRQARQSIRNFRRQLPPDHTITLTLNDRNALFRAGRIRRAIRRLDDDARITINTRGPDANTVTRRIRRTLAGPFRVTGGLLGGILSDGLGQGIIGAFQKAGPVAMVVLAGIIAASVSVIGAALAGVLILAFGGAFAALGGFIAAKSDEVQNRFSKALETLKPLFKEAAEPMIPVLVRGIGLVEQMGKRFAPAFERFLTEAAPQIENFFKSLKTGFENFGEVAWKPLTDAFRVFLDAFGPEWEGFMGSLGKSFKALANTVRDHSTEIALALRIVLEIIPAIIDVVNFLANAWVVGLRVMSVSVGILLKSIGLLLQGFLDAVDAMLAGLETLAEPLGLGDTIKTARENIRGFKEDATAKFRELGNEAIGWGKRLDKANARRKLQVDISSWKARLKAARRDLRKTSNQKAKAKLRADISELERKIRQARGQLDSLNGKTATTYVRTVFSEEHDTRAAKPFRYMGGVVGKAATGGVRSNMTLVGEQGPELVDLAPGSHVRSNPDTRRMLGQQGGGGGVIEVRSGGSQLDDLLVEILRRSIHAKGGNVQNVLGSGRG